MRFSKGENGRALESELPAVVARCREDGAALSDLQAVYDQVNGAVAAAGLSCLGGGTCCRFDLAEHRLYLSGLELALLTVEPPPDLRRAEQMRCPYQLGPACAAYPRRPLGCRSFFCSPGKKVFLREIHEQSHRRIRRLHQTLCIPYTYGEICQLLLQFYSRK
jgi:Fe-S-cluster containining protein